MEGPFYQEKLHYTRMRRRRHQRQTACPRSWTWFVWPFIMFSWLLRPLHINHMLFYHRPDCMLILEINPIVEFVTNYLCLVLGYLGKFLYYKVLTAWPWENLLKKKIIVIFRSLLILLDGIPSLGQLIMPPLTLAINLSFPLLLKLNQSNKQISAKEEKSPIIMGWIYIDNTRLWQFRFKVSSMLETIKSY